MRIIGVQPPARILERVRKVLKDYDEAVALLTRDEALLYDTKYQVVLVRQHLAQLEEVLASITDWASIEQEDSRVCRGLKDTQECVAAWHKQLQTFTPEQQQDLQYCLEVDRSCLADIDTALQRGKFSGYRLRPLIAGTPRMSGEVTRRR